MKFNQSFIIKPFPLEQEPKVYSKHLQLPRLMMTCAIEQN